MILLEFLSQRCTVHAENLGRAGLVALRVVHDRTEQRRFDFAEHQAIQLSGLMSVQIPEVALQRFFGEIPEWPLAGACQLDAVAVVLFATGFLFVCFCHCTRTGGDVSLASRFPPSSRPEK